MLRKTRALPGFRLIPCSRSEPERLPDHKAGQRGRPRTNGGHHEQFRTSGEGSQGSHPLHRAQGFELLETGWTSPEGTQIDLIANDEDALVFIDVTATEYGEGGFEGGKVKRSDLEIAAASWLAGNTPDGDIQVRFDIVDMLVVSADRALLRHHINAFSCGVE